jgi:tellurite resistance protein TerC
MPSDIWFWIIFNAGVLCLLAIDLFGFQRKAHAPSTREAAVWTAVWISLSLGLNALVWHLMGPAKAAQFLTGYLIEYSLSVDNIFVFVLIFSYFAIPAAYQHRVLFWGILSALILRGVMIGCGVAFIQAFHWALYLFGAFLLFSGVKLLLARRKAVNLARNPLMQFVRKRLPVSDSYDGASFTIRREGRRLLTPLAMALIMVEGADVVFAIDSIPAIFGVTHDPLIVYTSNVCAILGLRSLYFFLAGAVHRFVHLKPGLAIILSFIGAKMLLTDVYEIPSVVSLCVVGLILSVTTVLSLFRKQQPTARAEDAARVHDHSSINAA